MVIRVYSDGKTKPHIDEFKRDFSDDVEIHQQIDDIEDFLIRNFDELADESDSDEDWVAP